MDKIINNDPINQVEEEEKKTEDNSEDQEGEKLTQNIKYY